MGALYLITKEKPSPMASRGCDWSYSIEELGPQKW